MNTKIPHPMMNSKIYQRQQTHPANSTSTNRTGRGNYNYPGGNRHTGYQYQAHKYQDSSLAMCWDVARDMAIDVYDYAEPKVIKGITVVKQMEIQGPQCGAVVGQQQWGRTKDRSGSQDSMSSASSHETGAPYGVEENPTLLSGSFNETKTACSSDGSEHSRKPRRPRKNRGRSPTFRSKSVNAADRKKEHEVLKMNPDNYIMMGPRRVVVADPELHSYLPGDCVDENGTQEPRQPEVLKRGFFRQSSGVDREKTSPKKTAMNTASQKEDPLGRTSPDEYDQEEYGYHPTTGYSPDASIDPTLSPTQVPSLTHHKDQGNDVDIVVGRGPKQEVFPHNSHVLLYISDYFSQVMEPNTISISGQSWMIDFSHRKVKEWKMFYPFLEPPAKRTASIDNHNLPILLPWFHTFQLPLLIHQCDNMLSSLYFRPPPGERADISSSTLSDLQDVLLLLYAGLSCDLPRTQELGIRVIEIYLKEAPFLFYSVTNGSVMRRLIILLQCFPHFQQQLWDSAIRSYLPPDLGTCFDIVTTDGRDNLFQNPLFPLLLREGLTKAKVKARNRQYLRSKLQQQQQHQEKRQGRRHSGTTSSTDDCSLEPNSIIAGSSIQSGMKRATTASTPFLEELSQRTSMIRPGHLSTEHFNRQPQMEQQNTNTEEDEGKDSVFLEMSIELGEQFWGSNWHKEPRFSREKHQRQRDRRRWLEDIVHQLKLHARQEEEQLQCNETNESVSHNEDTIPAGDARAQTHEEGQPQDASGGAPAQPETATGRWSPLDDSVATLSDIDAPAPHKYRERLDIQPRPVTQSHSPTSDDNRTTTTDTNSVSGRSAHTAEESKLSNEHRPKRMFH